MIYRRRSSPLHAAGAPAAGAFCAAIAVCALILDSPLALGGLAVGLLGAWVGAGLGAELRSAARWVALLCVPIALLNPLVAHQGLTVVARLGSLPVVGRTDITLEAIEAGGLAALRAALVTLAFMLAAAAVDPDEVLRRLRRLSSGVALSAAVGTRMALVLSADAKRVREARATRALPGPGGVREAATVLRALLSNALDRSLDVAAILELRGYRAGTRAARRGKPRSRHDVAFAVAASGLAAVAILARVAGWSGYDPYGSGRVSVTAGALAAAGALLALCVLPFGEHRGVRP